MTYNIHTYIHRLWLLESLDLDDCETENKTHSIKDTIAFNSGYRLDNGCYWLVNLSLIINNYEYNITHF